MTDSTRPNEPNVASLFGAGIRNRTLVCWVGTNHVTTTPFPLELPRGTEPLSPEYKTGILPVELREHVPVSPVVTSRHSRRSLLTIFLVH